jgi:hypothetical protein
MAEARDLSLRRLRVLIPTSRHVYRLVSYGMVVDFEDAVMLASDADLLPVPLHSRRAEVKALLRGRPVRSVSPPRQHYDVCFLVAMDGHWLPSLRYVRHLRRIVKRVVVYIFDSWVRDLAELKDYSDWSLVDDLVVSFCHALTPYSDCLPCRVHYLPQATDPRWFHPYREHRPIDVLSVGRRLPEVHRQLLEISRHRDLFYIYQTHDAPHAIDLLENQELLGRLCQSARVHVNWSVDRTRTDRAAEAAAITARWFESAASGAVVIGNSPPTEEFMRLFPYPGFVHHLDSCAPVKTEEVLDRAFADSRSMERRALAEHVRTLHSWASRWRQIVDTCGI